MRSAFIFINLFAVLSLIVSFIKDSRKTKQALIEALKSFLRLLPIVFIVILFIGFLMGFIPHKAIANIIGEQSGLLGILFIASLGAILHIPSLISFPLAASLLNKGASITSIAVFITTLTMIGTVTIPLEIKELGKKIAFLRNGISFIIAIIIALIIGSIL